MTKIYVDFQDIGGFSQAPFDDNDFINSQKGVGVLSADLLDDAAASTGVQLEVTTAFVIDNVDLAAATAAAGDFNDRALDSYWGTGNGTTSALLFSGLPVGATYSIDIAGHLLSSGRHSQYTVDGVAKDYLTSNDAASPTLPTNFTGTVGGAGEIAIVVEKAASGAFYGYINGIVLEYTAATSETATTGDIPLVIQAGYTKVDLVDPVTTDASLLFGVTGDAPVTVNDLEYDVTSELDSGVTLGVAATGVWTVTEAVEGDWVTDITVSRRVVQADGTIGTEAVLTLSAATGTTTEVSMIQPMVSNMITTMIH